MKRIIAVLSFVFASALSVCAQKPIVFLQIGTNDYVGDTNMAGQLINAVNAFNSLQVGFNYTAYYDTVPSWVAAPYYALNYSNALVWPIGHGTFNTTTTPPTFEQYVYDSTSTWAMPINQVNALPYVQQPYFCGMLGNNQPVSTNQVVQDIAATLGATWIGSADFNTTIDAPDLLFNDTGDNGVSGAGSGGGWQPRPPQDAN